MHPRPLRLWVEQRGWLLEGQRQVCLFGKVEPWLAQAKLPFLFRPFANLGSPLYHAGAAEAKREPALAVASLLAPDVGTNLSNGFFHHDAAVTAPGNLTSGAFPFILARRCRMESGFAYKTHCG